MTLTSAQRSEHPCQLFTTLLCASRHYVRAALSALWEFPIAVRDRANLNTEGLGLQHIHIT